MTFGESVRAARLASGLSQEEVAARRGRTQTWLSYIENDVREPNMADLIWLIYVLGLRFPPGSPMASFGSDADAVSVVLRDGEVDSTVETTKRVWVDLDADGRVLSLEILAVSDIVPVPNG